jgi:hypothetical protein
MGVGLGAGMRSATASRVTTGLGYTWRIEIGRGSRDGAWLLLLLGGKWRRNRHRR